MELRDLPSVDALAGDLFADFDLPRPVIVSVARDAIDEARSAIQSGSPADPGPTAARRLRALSSARLRAVINATGVLLHTNLGRAPIDDTNTPFFSNLEFDLESGERGNRASYLHTLIASTVGAEAALAVNNNAGALLLSLAALAGRDGRGRGVARRTDRDRRLVPAPGSDGRVRCSPRGGGDDEPDEGERFR